MKYYRIYDNFSGRYVTDFECDKKMIANFVPKFEPGRNPMRVTDNDIYIFDLDKHRYALEFDGFTKYKQRFKFEEVFEEEKYEEKPCECKEKTLCCNKYWDMVHFIELIEFYVEQLKKVIEDE